MATDSFRLLPRAAGYWRITVDSFENPSLFDYPVWMCLALAMGWCGTARHLPLAVSPEVDASR